MYTTLGDDIIFSGANSTFTLATGDRRCFNVTIVDDAVIEYDENFSFEVDAVNTSLTYEYFYDYTRIIVRDNEGQLHLHHNTDSGPKLISVKNKLPSLMCVCLSEIRCLIHIQHSGLVWRGPPTQW